MTVIAATEYTLASLVDFLERVNPTLYKQPIALFNGSTLGEHTRHVIEFYQCMQKNKDQGIINYDLRERDRMIQEDPEMACLAIKNVLSELVLLDLDTPINLEVAYDKSNQVTDWVASNVKREIAYNLEHAIHHMALIKVGVKVLCPELHLDDDFGVAPSTIKFKQGICAQ